MKVYWNIFHWGMRKDSREDGALFFYTNICFTKWLIDLISIRVVSYWLFYGNIGVVSYWLFIFNYSTGCQGLKSSKNARYSFSITTYTAIFPGFLSLASTYIKYIPFWAIVGPVSVVGVDPDNLNQSNCCVSSVLWMKLHIVSCSKEQENGRLTENN